MAEYRKDPKKNTIAALVSNRSGVLTRISGLFARRGYNIESLSVCATEDPDISRMTIVLIGDEYMLYQMRKQMDKPAAGKHAEHAERRAVVYLHHGACRAAGIGERQNRAHRPNGGRGAHLFDLRTVITVVIHLLLLP